MNEMSSLPSLLLFPFLPFTQKHAQVSTIQLISAYISMQIAVCVLASV